MNLGEEITLIAILVAITGGFLGSMYFIANVIGQRITDLGTSLGLRITEQSTRFTVSMDKLDTRMGKLDDSMVDVRDRLLTLEVKAGER